MLSLLCYNPRLLLLCSRFFVCSSPTMFRSSTLQINMDLNATNRGSILETPVTHPKTNTNPPYCITKPPKFALKKEENLIILQNISMWKKKKKERDIDIEPFRALCLLYSTQHCPPVALGSMGVTCSFHFLFFFFISVPVDCASSVIVFILGLSISCLFSRSFHHSSFVLCTHPYNPSLETSYLTIFFFFWSTYFTLSEPLHFQLWNNCPELQLLDTFQGCSSCWLKHYSSLPVCSSLCFTLSCLRIKLLLSSMFLYYVVARQHFFYRHITQHKKVPSGTM